MKIIRIWDRRVLQKVAFKYVVRHTNAYLHKQSRSKHFKEGVCGLCCIELHREWTNKQRETKKFAIFAQQKKYRRSGPFAILLFLDFFLPKKILASVFFSSFGQKITFSDKSRKNSFCSLSIEKVVLLKYPVTPFPSQPRQKPPLLMSERLRDKRSACLLSFSASLNRLY